MFEFSALDQSSSDPVTVPIEHPVTGEATGATVSILSYDSPIIEDWARERAKRQRQDTRFRKLTEEELLERGEANLLDLDVEIVRGWTGVQWHGAELPYSRENVRMVLTRMPWFRRWLKKKASDLALFTNRSAPQPSLTQSTSGSSASVPPGANSPSETA